MSLVERLQSVLVAGAAALGLVVGLSTPLGGPAGVLVLPALLVMLTAVFVQLDATQLAQAGRARSVLVASLVLNFVVTPALAWLLGVTLLADAPDLRIGLLLLLVTPCTDWYLVFTALARGNTGIAAALLPINLALQMLLLPVYVLLLGGDAAAIEPAPLVAAVLVALLVPLGLALVLRAATRRSPRARGRVEHAACVLVVPLLCLAVAAMFASQAQLIAENLTVLARVLVPLAVFFVVLPLLATLAARLLRLPGDQRVTLTMTTTARNSPLALGVAVAAFPDRPLIAAALVLGPLVELPVLALLAALVRVRTRPSPSS